MHAIGNYIMEKSNKAVLYVTSQDFISDYVSMSKKDESGTNFNYINFFKHFSTPDNILTQKCR